jgi:hypothetical protein
MHPAGLSKLFKCTSTSLFTGSTFENQSQFSFVIFKLCTNKNHSYKHNEQINSQNIDNSDAYNQVRVVVVNPRD